MHAQQLPHTAHAPPLPMMPHPALPGPPATAASLLGLSSIAGPASHPLSMLAAKPDLHREETKSTPGKIVQLLTDEFGIKTVTICAYVFLIVILPRYVRVFLSNTHLEFDSK